MYVKYLSFSVFVEVCANQLQIVNKTNDKLT